ncbi:MAG: tetratricopeptide repeat protein, partial [Muribaculaceae bacterium]|nr:tetratricopeptide repeat protein [Muribaculaceae bacterium]
SAPLYQKMGYCRQAIGDYAGAIDHYEQSELLNAESRWTMRRLAACHRAIGNWEKAVDYYKTLAVTKPDDDRLALNIGLSLVKLRRYDEALQYLFKAEFLGNSSEKSIRAIVWCTLLGADYDRCAKYTDILMSSSTPTPTDLLNAGHLQLLTGHPGEAAALYARSIAGRDFDTRAFLSELESDRCTIAAFAGISPRLLAIVTDKALSLAKGQGSNL